MANAAGGLNANTLFNMAAQEQAQAQPQQAAPAPQQSAPAAGEWICSCGAKNSGKFCTECGSKKPEPKPVEGWKCVCGNIATGKFCPECGAPKPAEEKPAEQKIFALTAGITKVRVYMWIEGQDVDCENTASGTDISYNLQFTIDN